MTILFNCLGDFRTDCSRHKINLSLLSTAFVERPFLPISIWQVTKKNVGFNLKWVLNVANLNWNWNGLTSFHKSLYFHISWKPIQQFSSFFIWTGGWLEGVHELNRHSLFYSHFQRPITSFLLGPVILLSTLFSNIFNLTFSFHVRDHVSHIRNM
jgi:hypothetical protein